MKEVLINPTYLPYLNKPHFLQIYFGGSSSGKSFFITDKIVLDNLDGCNWLCCRNVANTIRRSVFNEIIKSISSMDLMEYYAINKSDMIITCKLNQKQILFAGLDDPEKIKSITPMNGVLERVFIEEATEIKRDAYLQLKKRLRGKTEHSKQIIMAFNPILKSHWIYQDFFKEWRDDTNHYESDNYGATKDKKGFSISILKTTYKDNIFLTQDDIDLLENETDPYFYQVYTLGNFGVLGNVIFKNWRVEDLSELIPSFDNIKCAIDFGWNDPTAILKLHFDRKRKRIYIFDEVYQQFMRDDDVLKACREVVGKNYVFCDSADPRMIDFLALNGVLAVPVKKGSDSIMRGIRWLQGCEIIIDVKCQNFKNEIEQLHFEEDKYGNVLDRPASGHDHLANDCLRYALENEILAADTAATAIKRG